MQTAELLKICVNMDSMYQAYVWTASPKGHFQSVVCVQ